MSRWLAFSLFASAAFDWSLPFLDRAGAGLLGFAFLALSVRPLPKLATRPARMTFPPKVVELPEPEDTDADDLLARLAPYLVSPEPADRGSS